VRNQNLLKTGLIAVSLNGMLVAGSACNKGDIPITSVTGTTSAAAGYFQQFNALTVSLNGLATLKDVDNQTQSQLVSYSVVQVPIIWMGQIFNGGLKGVGVLGGDFNITVHGNLSQDGNWVENISYSREILRWDSLTAEYYRISLQNVPLTKGVNVKNENIGTSQKSGSDIQRYLSSVEFGSGFLNASLTPPIDSNIQYVSMDWKSTDNVPTLDVLFEALPVPPPGGGMIGSAM
jgi:hypothetical protein